MKEIWKDIKGFEGYYQISNMGRLKSFKQLKEGRVLSNKNAKGGYLNIVLNPREPAQKSFKIHRLVATHFIENPEMKPEVNHKDGDKTNNQLHNLEWVTRKENVRHSMKLKPWQVDGMIKRNKTNNPAKKSPWKMIVQKSLEGIIIEKFTSPKDAYLKTGICRITIIQSASMFRRKLKRIKAGGFYWEYEY